MGSPPGRPVKRARTNFAGPVPECVHINKRITAAQSAEVRLYMTHTLAAYLSILQCDLFFTDSLRLAISVSRLSFC